MRGLGCMKPGHVSRNLAHIFSSRSVCPLMSHWMLLILSASNLKSLQGEFKSKGASEFERQHVIKLYGAVIFRACPPYKVKSRRRRHFGFPDRQAWGTWIWRAVFPRVKWRWHIDTCSAEVWGMSNREDRPSSNEELKGDTYSTPRIQAFLAMRNLTKPVGKSAGQQEHYLWLSAWVEITLLTPT